MRKILIFFVMICTAQVTSAETEKADDVVVLPELLSIISSNSDKTIKLETYSNGGYKAEYDIEGIKYIVLYSKSSLLNDSTFSLMVWSCKSELYKNMDAIVSVYEDSDLDGIIEYGLYLPGDPVFCDTRKCKDKKIHQKDFDEFKKKSYKYFCSK